MYARNGLFSLFSEVEVGHGSGEGIRSLPSAPLPTTLLYDIERRERDRAFETVTISRNSHETVFGRIRVPSGSNSHTTCSAADGSSPAPADASFVSPQPPQSLLLTRPSRPYPLTPSNPRSQIFRKPRTTLNHGLTTNGPVQDPITVPGSSRLLCSSSLSL